MYYADDAISSNEKNPLEGKVAIHKSIKDLATFPKAAKISFQTKEVHISNDGIR
jgi:ketosteroid isomerase-like protein